MVRDYTKTEIDVAMYSVNNTDRIDLLSTNRGGGSKNIPLVLSTKYNPAIRNLGKIIRKHWHLIDQNAECNKLFPKIPIIGYKRNKNLADYLTTSSLK